jgi:23S rRNA U2552 (ribose-2'-O)-methylase RlmE/FtsJ
LWSDFQTNSGKIIHKWKHYFPIYERHFQSYVNKPLTFLEIGVGRGGSLQMWKRYFGPHARIVGIDIVPGCKRYEEDQIEVPTGKQQDERFLQSILDEFGSPDIVLDDGSHRMADLIETFRFLYPRTATNGVYMVEDLHTAYWEECEGCCGRLRPSSSSARA